jgi:hypothetical protein
MTTKGIAILAIAAAIGFFILAIVGMRISCSNDEIGLRNQAKAQQDCNKIIYDKVWKTISQIAQVAAKYEEAFKTIYTKIMDERYGKEGDNLLAKFITEQNPNLSTDLYNQIIDAVKANRAEFATVQKKLVDIKREHDNLRQKFPGSIFVGSRPELQIQIVTSTKTEETFKSGKEDDVKLF